jgi:HEPN domain-containing protein
MNEHEREADRWLTQARHDLRAAISNRREGFPEIACFLAQQVAEKALRAYLYAQGQRVVTDHAAHLLVRACNKYDQAFGDLGDACRSLDQYYVPTRYPDGLPGGVPHEVYSDAQAREATNLAQQVLDLVAKLTNL